MKIIIITLLLFTSFANSNRILAEVSQTSNKWKFNLFTSTAEQNSQTYQLDAEELLLIQNIINEDGKAQIKMNKFLRDGTQLTLPKILGDQLKACSRPRVTIIPSIGFFVGWIQRSEQNTQLYLQFFHNDLTSLGEQVLISNMNEELHWDLSSEYFYIYNLENYRLLLLYKEPNNDKAWSGTIYNYNTQQFSNKISLNDSKFIEIAQNGIGNIILIQRVQIATLNTFLLATKLNQNGQIIYSKNVQHIRLQSQFEPRLVALSNNNFVLFYQLAEQIYYQVYNQHFDQLLFTSYSKYQALMTPTWEYNNYFRGGQIQVQALEDSVVLVGVNYNNLRFQLVQLNNDFLEFIQQREIHYEDLNIYKFTIQKTSHQTIFVQWTSGNPLTLLPEFTQSLYQSELDLKLTLSKCGTNCDHCDNNFCLKCNTGYSLNNNKCQIQCQDNCLQCSTQNSCDICKSGYVLNNKMNCVAQSNSVNQELKVSLSESSHKYNQQVKQFNDGSLLVYYLEYLNKQQVLQFRVISSDGQIIQASQINNEGWAGYDIVLSNDTTAYLYTLEKSEGYKVIKQRQFNPKTFEFSTVIRLQIQYQGFQYQEDIENTLVAVGFQNSVCLMLKGLDNDSIYFNLAFYTYNGEFLANQYLGSIQYVQNYSSNDEDQRFDFDYDDSYFYVVITRGCNLQLLQFNLNGQKILEDNFSFLYSVICNNFVNPSLQKVAGKNRYMIAAEMSQNIVVFNWKDSTLIYQTDIKIKAKKPKLLAQQDNNFILLYEEYDLNDRFTTINYLRFQFNEVVVDKIINSQSVLPQNLKVINQENQYLILSWLAYNPSNIQSTNQVYLERIQIDNDLVLGFGKQCSSNCANCNQEKECLSCNTDYYLNEFNKCQLICPQGCSTCQTKTFCLVCQNGYQLNKVNVCEQNQKNSIAILQQNVQIIESVDLDLTLNGNLYISWMEKDNQNIQRTFIKQIDVHGQQVGAAIPINLCTSIASKIYTTSYFNVLSTICGNIEYGAELQLHFYNLNFDTRYSFWTQPGIRIISYSIHDTPYEIQVVSDREIIVVQQIMNSDVDVYLKLYKLCKSEFDNQFFICSDQVVGNNNQKLQDLSLFFDHQSYFINFKTQQTLEDGSIQLQKHQITVDQTFNIVSHSQLMDSSLQRLILSNQNKLEISNSNSQIQFKIFYGNKLLNQHTIEFYPSDNYIQMDQIDVAATEQGFYIVWIEETQQLDATQRQIKAQGFYNNGTQITEIQNLLQSSNQPNEIFIQSVRNNQLFVIWQDRDETGQKLLAARYNQMLQQLSLNTVLCQSNCDICQNSNICSKCSQGYYYNTDQQQCQLICPSNCEVCTQKDICDICQYNYYIINDQCVFDASKQYERVLADIENSEVTKVSLSAFLDNGFVLVWNDNIDGTQAIQMQLYNNMKEKQQDLITFKGESDRQHAQVEVLDGDSIALAWFEGQCSISCRLQLQIFDRFGVIQTNELTIAVVTLPPLGRQSPVVIKRFDRKLIIAYIAYENEKTVGYSTSYDQDTFSLQSIQVIDPDQNVDNLNIVSKNGYYNGILYLKNNKEIILVNHFAQECWIYPYWGVSGCGYNDRLSILQSDNPIQQISILMRLDNFFIMTWIEKISKNGFLIDKTYFTRCAHNFCEIKKELITNSYDENYIPQLVGQYGQFGYLRFSIIYGTQEYLSHLKKTIKLQSFHDYESIDRTIQASIQSQKLQRFITYEFINGDVFIISVGQTSESGSQILMNVVNLLGDQQKLVGSSNCQQNCLKCDASLTCFNCNTGYSLVDGQCQRQCDKNCLRCDPYLAPNQLQCFECELGYKLNSLQQCLPSDTSIIQSLINTYQSGNQYGQRVATLSNYQSVVVWNSENQDKNGKSIYMQLYDQQMNKIGGETLVTKDNIGIQEEPDIVALPNNQFIIIWKDNHSNQGRRIIMQRFKLSFERVGDEIVVYDSQTDLATNAQSQINYINSHHKIAITQAGQISVLLFLQQQNKVFEIRFKQFNSNYIESTSSLIGLTSFYEQTSINTINNLLLFTWKSNDGIKVVIINEIGVNINGLLIPNSQLYRYPSIVATSEDQILIACVGQKFNQLLIFKQNLELSLKENPKVVGLEYQIADISLMNMNSGYVIAFKQIKQANNYQSDLINLLIYDRQDDLVLQNNIQVNDYYGSITDIRVSSLSNEEFIVTWTQVLNGGAYQINERNIDDLSGNGVYVKRFNMVGQVQSIQNIVCQSYCKQCSKQNLCEACSDGYQFDDSKLICLPICQSNCNYCSRFLGQYKSYCHSCKDGLTINDQGDCVKLQEQQVTQLYKLGNDFRISQILTLTNGNIVIIQDKMDYEQLYLNIIDSTGKVVLDSKQMNEMCCRKLTKAAALTNGNFAIVQRLFNGAAGGDGGIQLFVLDSEGRIIKQDNLYYPYYWGQPGFWNNQHLLQINSLSNGGFVLLYVSCANQFSSSYYPQLHLRIYNQEFYQVSNDIIIQTYFKLGDQYQYWDYWNYYNIYYHQQNQAITVLESVNSIVISFGTHLYNLWEENKNKNNIQMFVYSKEGQFILNKQISIPNNDWWVSGFTPKFYLFEIEINKFLLIYFNNRNVYGQFYDEKFNLQVEESLTLENQFQNSCYGCCIQCWDYISSQVVLVKNTIVMTNKPNVENLYISSYNLNFKQITTPQKVSNDKYKTLDYLKNQHYLVNNQLETLLLAQQVDYNGARYVLLDKFDKNCNKIKQWSGCDENCLDCAESSQECLTCKNGYYVDETQKCKKNCDIQSCLVCENLNQISQFCRICQEGYQLKDNFECVLKDNSRIIETKLSSSSHQAQNTPRIKALQDGRIVLISLSSNNKILGQFYNSKGEQIDEQVILLEEEGINHFDFSVSTIEDQIILVWINNYQNNAKALRFNGNLQLQSASQIYILDNIQQFGVQQITVEFQQNNYFFVCVLFSEQQNWIRIINEQDSALSIMQIPFTYYVGQFCNQYGCWQCNQYECHGDGYYYYQYQYLQNPEYQYIDYFSESFAREPSILVTQNYIVVAFAQYNRLQLSTFDLNGNLLFKNDFDSAKYFQYQLQYQPSIAQLENGKIVIVWKDALTLYNYDAPGQQIEKQKQSIIAYTITDEQFQNLRIQYIGMDYVQEERPDVAAIPNGFAISWSGRSERNNQNIDLRIAYFDLYGNLQTGFIPVSSICNRPINSQITKLSEGSILVSWYQDNDIYVQKLDRNGVLYPLTQPINCALFCSRCDKEGCLQCMVGYELNDSKQCQYVQPKCNIENCQVCEFGWTRCMQCNEGYFLEENFDQCTQIDSNNKEYKLAQTKVINDHSSAIVSVEDGTIIHLWLDIKDEQYILKGSTFSQYGSSILKDVEVQNWPKDVFMQVKSQKSNIIILIYNSDMSTVLIINSSLQVVNSKIDITNIIKKEFSISYEWQNQKLQTYNDGLVIEITGVKQQIINQFSLNPEIKRCSVVEVFIFDLNVELSTQPFGFYMDGQPSSGIVDSGNQCKFSKIFDVLYDSEIYVVGFQQSLWRYSIQAYNYKGEKLREGYVNFLYSTWWYEQNALKIFKHDEQYLLIIGQEGKGNRVQISNLQDDGIIDYYHQYQFYTDHQLMNFYDGSKLQYIKQQFGLVSRWKIQVFPFLGGLEQYSLWVSKFTVKQQSFSILKLNDGQVLFSWVETANNSNSGSIQIVRLNQNKDLDYFQRFQCLQNCKYCSNDNTCDICQDNYENINNKECKVICPALCEYCIEPSTCQICEDTAYLNDDNQCYIPETAQIEIPIPIKKSDTQINPRIASFKDGNFVVVWQASNQDGDGFGVYLQKFNSQIERIGDEIRVNVNILNNQYYPDITILENQNVIIVWADGNIETQATLQYQRFDQDLNRIGNPVIIDNIRVLYIQQYDTPFVVQSLPLNKFVICWISSADQNTSSLYLSLIDSNGVQVNTYNWNHPDQMREVGISSNGLNLVVLVKWNCNHQAIIFNLEGQEQFRQELQPGCQSSAAITTNSKGEYVVSFVENGQVLVQIYNNQFNLFITTPKLDQYQLDSEADNPDVLTLNENSIVVVWQNSDRMFSRSRKLKMQILDSAGVPQSDVKEVNLVTKFSKLPQLSLLNNNQFVVVWQGINPKQQFDSEQGVYLMRFNNQGIQGNPSVPICPDKCEKCQESKTCLKCQLDYELNNNECTPKCPQNCQQCDTSNICDICKLGFELNTVGYCDYIKPDPLPQIVPIIGYPNIQNPSFKSILTFGETSVLIYGAYIFQAEFKNYLDVSLILINDNDKSQQKYHSQIEVDGEWFNIYNSDILVVGQEIIIYWSEQSYSVGQVLLKQIRLNANLIEIQQSTIHKFDFAVSEHINRKIYLFSLNENYYIFQSIATLYGQYEFYGHLLDKDLIVKIQPKKLWDTYNIIQRKQILIIENQFLITQYQIDITWLRLDQNLESKSAGNSDPYFNYGETDFNSITIQWIGLQNQFVIAWRSKSQQSLSSFNEIKYRILNPNFQFTDPETKVVTSQDVIQNPVIIVTDKQFYILWNQETVVSSMLNYKLYSGSISSSQSNSKLNRLDNNIVFYTGTKTIDQTIYVIWVSYFSTAKQYQYFMAKINETGTQVIDPPTCPSGCQSCSNQFACSSCKADQIYDQKTYQCYKPCSQDCADCNSQQGVCNTCKLGYKLVNNDCLKNICQNGCELCDELQNCLKCNSGYEIADKYTCKYSCDVNCQTCGIDQCLQCKESYYWSEQDKLCVDITVYIYQTSKEKPLKAVFESKDYVLMWYETGLNEGIYIQLYKSNGKPVGRPTKVNEEDLLGTRRILQQTNNFDVRLFADLAAIKNELIVLWVDQTQGDMMKLKFKKFDNNNTQLTQSITIREQPKQNLTNVAAPCIIKPTSNNQFVIGWFNKQEQNLKQTATMLIQSFNSELKPIGQVSTLNNADFTQVPLIQTSEEGKVYITYTSQGYTYLAQMSKEGEQIGTPFQVSQVYQTIKSINLNDGNMVFVFESQSTNVSPPQFVLSYEIVKQEKRENNPFVLTQQQYGEQHPDILSMTDAFIITWRSVDKSFKSQDVYFQIFDNSGNMKSQQIKVKRQGLHPQNPKAQILNQDELVITWTAEKQEDPIKYDIFKDSFKISAILNDYQDEDQKPTQQIICSQNCLYCEISNTCMACQQGYYTVNDQCVIDCPVNCQSCSKPLICDVCQQGYQTTSDNECEFVSCEQGYQLNDDNECVLICSNNCLECQSNNQCLECETNYQLYNGICSPSFDNMKEDQQDQEMPYYYIIIIVGSILILIASLIYAYKLYQRNITKRANRYLANQVEERAPQNTVINTIATMVRDQPENLQFD